MQIFTTIVKIFDGNWWIYARNAVLNNLSHLFDYFPPLFSIGVEPLV